LFEYLKAEGKTVATAALVKEVFKNRRRSFFCLFMIVRFSKDFTLHFKFTQVLAGLGLQIFIFHAPAIPT
jgi:hypothetical protein